MTKDKTDTKTSFGSKDVSHSSDDDKKIAILSHQAKTAIDKWIAKFPSDQRQSAVVQALMIIQEENGYLSEPLMDAVAAYLRMPKIAVYEVASFYSMFNLKPVGRYKLEVCTNICCMLRNSDEIVSHLKKRLEIELGETTEDGKFTLKAVECLAACGGAPAMQIGKKFYENLTPERIDQILNELE